MAMDASLRSTQASPTLAHDALMALRAEPPSVNDTIVSGFPMSERTRREITVRLATAEEVQSLPAEGFSRCTVPLVFHTLWQHNFGEWTVRGPASFIREQVDTATLPDSLSIVVSSPQKLPVPRFNLEMLRPFSRYAPASFADFSSRLPASFPSKCTAEGRHVRCFHKLLVWAT